MEVSLFRGPDLYKRQWPWNGHNLHISLGTAVCDHDLEAENLMRINECDVNLIPDNSIELATERIKYPTKTNQSIMTPGNIPIKSIKVQ